MKTNRFHYAIVVTIGTLAASTPAWALFQEVPEPNIVALFGIGAAGAILATRYFKKK
jgi:hypothetical protein